MSASTGLTRGRESGTIGPVTCTDPLPASAPCPACHGPARVTSGACGVWTVCPCGHEARVSTRRLRLAAVDHVTGRTAQTRAAYDAAWAEACALHGLEETA